MRDLFRTLAAGNNSLPESCDRDHRTAIIVLVVMMPVVLQLVTDMNGARRTTLSLAAFVLICFFLPWLQVSCVGMKDSVSGFDLARDKGDGLLWLVPILMFSILILGLVRSIWEKMPAIFALAGTVGGGVSAYVMYHERSITNSSPRLVATYWTVFFWLGLVASLGVLVAAFLFYIRKSRSP